MAFFAAGILANIIIGEYSSNESFVNKRKEYAFLLAKYVELWQEQDSEVVAYRSFKPFIPLLQDSEYYGVQLWALWAIGHVCKLNGKRYLPMIQRDGILSVLSKRLLNDRDTSKNTVLRKKAETIIDYYKNYQEI